MGMRRVPITVSSLSIQSMVLDYSKIGNPMTTPPTPAEVEALARQFCVEAGLDPDEMLQRKCQAGAYYAGPRWMMFSAKSADHICMARAYDKLKAAK